MNPSTIIAFMATLLMASVIASPAGENGIVKRYDCKDCVRGPCECDDD
ncbi:hypothetical protein CLAFUW4_03965 [Fulvia fulva]|nr:uncharacterized protein CLAFUR5_20171 [Fulvia fulva]KAK4627088.1 hypothetical protein CLAFUR4_03951 [Fulvia fulva]KAK4628031.1 hypothetical protein CLAFUR0_03952 [Fulvia fulva]WMI38847.1 hypothetical protein CLAFUR5_20171 [Fulvia fulva]WPV13168.1 hypothetical protein CLAFUW4_03965 [Fulvia fulva]WPV29057.1 hypothetical protein CLAFUW7_03954 [Fulvia fulva]